MAVIGTFRGLDGDGKLPSSAKNDLSTDITTPSSAVRQALDAAGLGKGASDADIAALVKNKATSTGGALHQTFPHHDQVLVGPGIDPTGVADSTTAVQAKINAVPVGGSLFVPRGYYKLTAALVINKSMTIRGASFSPVVAGNVDGGGLDYPKAPYLQGAVFVQTAPGVDGILINGSGVGVNLFDLGVLFQGTHAESNTGHGINASPTQVLLDGHDTGLSHFKWSNIGVHGQDGNHYAFSMLNPIHGVLDHIRGWGGGGLSVRSDSNQHYGHFGNLVLTQPAFMVRKGGTAHGVHLETVRSRALNLLTFVRPQVNFIGGAGNGTNQAMWTSTRGTGVVMHVDVIDPDLESWETNAPIEFGGAATSDTIIRNGGAFSQMPVGGYNTGAKTGTGYQKFTANGTFTVPATVTSIKVRAMGGGGGGGGGGSASTFDTQVGGAGGGAGATSEGQFTVTPGAVLNVTVGAGGAGGAGGVVGGAAGANGGNGGASSLVSYVGAAGGGGGQGSPTNSTATTGGGYFGRGSWTIGVSAGFGGQGAVPNGYPAISIPPGQVGGGGGGASTATNGGGGGAVASVFPRGYAIEGGTSGASTTADGLNGASATANAPGCGGGGGGGGTKVTGKGGNGGNGGAGLVEIWW